MNKREFPWINTEINLFDMTIGIPLWLQEVSVTEVKWLKGNPKSGTKAIVTLCEFLSDSSFLIGLTEDSRLTFDLIRREHGKRADYDSSLVIGSFTNCEILSKWVDDLVITDPSLQGIIGVFIQMRVTFKLVLK